MRLRTKTKHINASEATVTVAVPHDRYTVAFDIETHLMWVIDTAGHDPAHGPFLATRQAWAVANDLNIAYGDTSVA